MRDTFPISTNFIFKTIHICHTPSFWEAKFVIKHLIFWQAFFNGIYLTHIINANCWVSTVCISFTKHPWKTEKVPSITSKPFYTFILIRAFNTSWHTSIPNTFFIFLAVLACVNLAIYASSVCA